MMVEHPKEEWLDFPGVNEGVRGMAFVDNVMKAERVKMKWKEFTLSLKGLNSCNSFQLII